MDTVSSLGPGTLARAALRGPFALEGRRARVLGVVAIALVTVLTQVGAIVVWPCLGAMALLRGRARAAVALGGVAAYVGFVLLALPVLAAPFGRVPLPCAGGGALVPRSIVFCLAARNYVVPALRDDALAIAADVRAHEPEASVAYLDAAFPFRGLPILPHLSHGDARRLDLALAFEDGTGSPIGYFGYAPLSPDERAACPERWLDLRWDLDFLQPLFGPPRLDAARTSRLVRAAVARPGIARVLLEPHVAEQLGIRSSKVRFQGCHAARHDDHMHIELAR